MVPVATTPGSNTRIENVTTDVASALSAPPSRRLETFSTAVKKF